MAPFTFYGDLLGISNAYKLSPQAGYEKLDRFYNLCFQHLKTACQGGRANVNLFSDSILFWGNNAESALGSLKQLYMDLTSEGLLLRGAIIRGKLEFDPRFTVNNFEKNLPKGDILPRAVGFAKNFKGARLIVDQEIAHDQLPSVDWHTVEGYLRANHDYQRIPRFDLRRFICPVPDGTSYELLYFYPIQPGTQSSNYGDIIRRLQNTAELVSKDVSDHYKETIGVIKRSQLRSGL